MTNDEEDEHIEFVELEFDSEEENVEDNAIMSNKQYNILNSKLKMILQFLNNFSAFTTSSISKEDVEFFLKAQEMKMKNLLLVRFHS